MMLHDIEYVPDKKGKIVSSNDGRRLTANPRFFMAELRGGILDVPPLEQTHS